MAQMLTCVLSVPWSCRRGSSAWRWLSSGPSAWPRPGRRLSCRGPSPCSPSTPPPRQTPPLIRPSWASCAHGAASSSWCCLTSGPSPTLWTPTGHAACPALGSLWSARAWTAWAPCPCTRWPSSRRRPSLSSWLRPGASRRERCQSQDWWGLWRKLMS